MMIVKVLLPTLDCANMEERQIKVLTKQELRFLKRVTPDQVPGLASSGMGSFGGQIEFFGYKEKERICYS